MNVKLLTGCTIASLIIAGMVVFTAIYFVYYRAFILNLPLETTTPEKETISPYTGESYTLVIIYVTGFGSSLDKCPSVTADVVEGLREIGPGMCYGWSGGLGKMHYAYTELRKNVTNVLLLNAGNVLGGFNYELLNYGSTIPTFLNMFPFDANVIGFVDVLMSTTEFHRDDYLTLINTYSTGKKYAGAINCEKLDAKIGPMLCADSFVVKKFENLNVAIVGALSPKLNWLLSEYLTCEISERSLRTARAKMDAIISSGNINTVVILSSMSCEENVELIELIQELWSDLPILGIIGGDGNTIMYSQVPPNGKRRRCGHIPIYNYPMSYSKDEHTSLIYADCSGRSEFLGYINVTAASTGSALSWEGIPIYLDEEIYEDEEGYAVVESISKLMEEKNKVVIDLQNMTQPFGYAQCYYEACSMAKYLIARFQNTTNELLRCFPERRCVITLSSRTMRNDLRLVKFKEMEAMSMWDSDEILTKVRVTRTEMIEQMIHHSFAYGHPYNIMFTAGCNYVRYYLYKQRQDDILRIDCSLTTEILDWYIPSSMFKFETKMPGSRMHIKDHKTYTFRYMTNEAFTRDNPNEDTLWFGFTEVYPFPPTT